MESTDKIDELADAARELAEYASYAEIVGGVSVNKPQIRRECDRVFAALKHLESEEA
ncbi:hypothetical protein [Roseibium alexandrii]|uniref:hypothetical protein n=1 Tax=Roseibium alexandrii TaxID=388408 RepID=UPI003750DB7B